jgi:hypothetical protein
MTWELILSFGFWPAVPVAGRWLVTATGLSRASQSALGAAGVASALGIAVWSPVLLAVLVAGSYSPELIGVIGWVIVLAFAAQAFLRHARTQESRPAVPPWLSRLDAWDVVLAAGLIIAAALYLGFSGEFVIGGRDENSYTLHGLWIAQHHRLDIPYPWPSELHDIFYDAFLRFSGTFRTEPTMTPAFGHVLPVWIAQATSTFGYDAMPRMNGVFSMLSLAIFYDVCRRAMSKPFAVVATVILALNPGQIWASRTAVTEILTQLLMWAGIALLLHALAAGTRAGGRWVGIVLGVAVLVRIDVLVIVPLLFLAHLGTRVLEDESHPSGSAWRGLYEGAIPAMGLAILYYLLFSRPYLRELVPQLSQVAVIAAGALIVLVVAMRRPIQVSLQRLAASTPMLVGLGLLLGGATVYAYLIRPIDTPFTMFGPEQVMLAGKRTYAEDALPNLAAYLTPPVIIGAVLGWFIAFCRIARGRSALLMPLVVIGGGFSFLYLANPSVTPDHFWAVRRFVPIIIPAFVAFALFGAGSLLAPFRRAWTTGFCAAALVLFIAFTAQAMAPFAFLTEHNGYRSQLEALADRLPEDEIVLAINQERWWKPLYTLFGRHVVDLSLSTRVGRAAFTTWVAAELGSGHEPLVLGVGRELLLPGLRVELGHTTALTRLQHRGTPTPLPTEVTNDTKEISIFRIVGADEAYGFRDINLVDGLNWGETARGLHDRELYQNEQVTWTDGSAAISIPIRAGQPRQLSISIAASAVSTGPLRVIVNGVELFNGAVPEAGLEQTFGLEGVPFLDTLDIELLSESRLGAHEVAIDGSLYRSEIVERRLGVAIRTLQVSGTLDNP